MTLPADSHVHSQWSWDAPAGSMVDACAEAVRLGLPAVAFTEHLDHTVWMVERDGLRPDGPLFALTSPEGLLTPPPFDAAGYLASVEECRDRFPGLRILSGVEAGEPHWHAEAVAGVLAAGRFDRVLGSLHCLPVGDGFTEPPGLFARRPAADVLHDYLTEIAELVTGSDAFSVLAHIDYPIRHWPEHDAGPFDVSAFEEPFRYALRATAASGRALEINTRRPLDAVVLRWWRAEGGDAVTFGSDAHLPWLVGHGFRAAADLAEAHGFRPGRHPYDVWGTARTVSIP